MKGNTFLKKLLLFSLLTTFLLITSSCSYDNNNNQQPGEQNTTNISTPSQQGQDKELTDKLNKEKEILAGQVYLQDDIVVGTMVIKEGISEKDAKQLAQSYADELKGKYKDKKINVQAVQNNKNIATIIMD